MWSWVHLVSVSDVTYICVTWTGVIKTVVALCQDVASFGRWSCVCEWGASGELSGVLYQDCCHSCCLKSYLLNY